MHFLISKLSWNDTVFFVKFFNTLPEISANCPSDQCWTYDATTDTCTVKSGAECGYSLTCGGDAMSFDFPEELFGTDNPVNFVEHDGCHPTVQVDFCKNTYFHIPWYQPIFSDRRHFRLDQPSRNLRHSNDASGKQNHCYENSLYRPRHCRCWRIPASARGILYLRFLYIEKIAFKFSKNYTYFTSEI